MEKIKTKSDFENLLRLNKAVVFIFFEWSGQAHYSKRIVSDWKNQHENSVPMFEINPEDCELFAKWVYEEVKDVFGYGSLVWLQNGTILDFEKDIGKVEISEIQSKTSKIFYY